MNDLESKLRQSLDQNIGRPPTRSLTDDLRHKVARSRRRAVVSRILLAVVVVGIAAAGIRLIPDYMTASPASGGEWPVMKAGSPKDAYVSAAEIDDIVGLRYVLSTGTVSDESYTFSGWTSRRADTGHPTVCLDLAGPSSGEAAPLSPEPVPPGGSARDGGVGGYCMPNPAFSAEAGWPDFPSQSDLFFRTVAPGGGGVCERCVVGSHGPFAGMGFASDRVDHLSITMANGATHDVPVLRFPNAWGVSAFIYFQPDVSQSGTFKAFDKSGRLLATAPICDSWHCDVPEIDQVAPIPSTAAPASVDAPTFPYYASVGGWPALQAISDADRPDQKLLASGDASPLVSGSADGMPFDAYVQPDGSGCGGRASFIVATGDTGASPSTADICTALDSVPRGGSWFAQTTTGVAGSDVVLMGIVTSDYGDIRVTLDDGSSQYLRLFKVDAAPSLRFFVSILPSDANGTLFLSAPDGTYIASHAVYASDAASAG